MLFNETMKTVAEIRRENLLNLIEGQGSIAKLNERLQMARTDATLSQIKNQSLTSRGNPKMMGATLARRIETALGLGEGWMDNDHRVSFFKREQLEHVHRVMENMPEYKVLQIVKIVDALAEPAANLEKAES